MEHLMDDWEKNNLMRGDSVDLAICFVAVMLSNGHWDISTLECEALMAATLECEALMAGCLFSTTARCNFCFWSLSSRGISLISGKISAARSEHFPQLLHLREWCPNAFPASKERFALIEVYFLIFTL